MRTKQHAFTLVELLVSTTVLTLLMVMLVQMTSSTANTWRYGAAKSEQFQEARKAFDTMTRRISEATLNAYWDYNPPLSNLTYNNAFAATIFPSLERQSELRFRVVNMPTPGVVQGDGETTPWYPPSQGIFFQAPLGVPANKEYLFTMNDLLNNWGYFVETLNTRTNVPKFLSVSYPNKYRSRLIEMQEGTEYNNIYGNNPPTAALTMDMGGKTNTNPYGRIKDPLIATNNPNGLVPIADDLWFSGPLNLPLATIGGGSAPSTAVVGVGALAYRPTHVLAENILALVILPNLTPEDNAAHMADPNTNPAFPYLSPTFSYHSKQTSNYAPNGPSPVDPYIDPKNQLPPVVQVAMYAIDEQSAQKFAAANPVGTLNMANLFTNSGGQQLFTQAANLESSQSNPNGGDLNDFETNLIAQKLSYRLFTTKVSIRAAKWSRTIAQ